MSPVTCSCRLINITGNSLAFAYHIKDRYCTDKVQGGPKK